MAGSDDNKRLHSAAEIENWNLDRSVDAPVKVTGLMGKNSDGSYEYLSSANRRLMVSGSFDVTANSAPLSADSSSISAISEDAGKFRVSAIGVSVNTSPLSADSSSISAKQQDASNLRTSAIVDSGSVSAKSDSAGQLRMSAFSDDAGKMRVSALGVSVSTSPLSADSSSVSAKQESAGNLRMSAFSDDAGLMRVSALGVTVTGLPLSADSSSISAIQEGANRLRVSAFVDSGSLSAKSSDAGTFRVSGIGTFTTTGLSANQSVSSLGLEGTAFIGNVSATLKAGTANIGFVSAKSEDAGLLRMSAIGTLTVSAHEVKQSDAASLRVSSFPSFSYTFANAAFDIGTTDTAVVSGTAAQRIYVYAVNLGIVPSGGVKWTGAGADLQGITRLSASAGYTMTVNPPAYIIATTSAGTDLELALSGTISASGWLAYWKQ